jgi:hypothetical protein
MSKSDAESERLALEQRATWMRGMLFKRRCPELLALEGWYEYTTDLGKVVRFKLSCRYKDILRCSVWRGHKKHFESCFAPTGVFNDYPPELCKRPQVAIVYLPDKHGNFQARAWVTLSGGDMTVFKVYGNGLDANRIVELFIMSGLRCHAVGYDISLY